MSVSGDKNSLSNCGCCESDSLEYPEYYNRPGQDAIKYRLDTHSGFVNRMLARLSRDQLTDAAPGNKRPLEKLTTRSDDDPSVAILDAWGVVADVLTFYQERIANEGFIRTATERRSVLEMARAIGYELNPGVAASTWLAFTADNSPGSPPSALVQKGTQVLSIPGKDELPQTFETTEDITARADWNALKPYTAVEAVTDPVVKGITQLRLKGTGLGLKPGDGILIVGDEKLKSPESEYWDFRILTEVTKSENNAYTLVKWERGLGHVQPPVSPAASNIKIHSFAVITAIFGKNAADWGSLHNASRAEYLEKLLGTTSNISVSKNGRRMVFAGNNNSLRVWTYNFYQKNWIKESIDIGTVGAVTSVAVSSYGTTIVLGHSDGALSKVRKSGGVWLRESMPASGTAHNGDVITQVAFSETDNYVLSVDIKKTAKVWYTNNRTLQRTYVPQMTVVPTGTSIKYRVGSDGQSLSRWSFTSIWEEIVIAPQAHDDIISSMAISSDATKILSGSADGTLKLWTLSSGAWSSQAFLDGNGEAAHTGPVTRVAFSDDAGNSEVISTSINGISRRWNATSRNLLMTFDNDTLDYLSDWPDYDLIAEPDAPELMLEDHYPGIVNKSWVVLSQPSYVELYNVKNATKVWHSQFNISGDVTRLELDNAEHLNWFDRRETIVYAQNNKLELYAEEVLTKLPIEGTEIELDRLTPELEVERRVVVSGRRMRVRILVDKPGIFKSADGFTEQTLLKNHVLIAVSRPVPTTTCCSLNWEPTDEGFVPKLTTHDTDECGGVICNEVVWHLQDRNGFVGTVTALAEKIVLIPSFEDDETASEVMLIDQLIETNHDDRKIINTLMRFETALANIYDHDSVVINANVAPASHGETVPIEYMGSGNGTSINQSFVLNKTPLTYVSAPTPTGGESTLEVRVNNVLWEQAPSLYGLGPRSQRYILRHDDTGNSIVTFGDGRQGARLPSGQENIVATYRSGIGPDGEVGSGTLRLLKSKPLGIREVNNPLSATGAAAPEVLADARSNAPMTVLTLDRIVSINDFEDFAAAFSGIGKAQAAVLWNGETNVVHITIATASGGTVNANDQLYGNLLAALDKARDTTVQVLVDGYDEIRFMVEAKILVDSRYLREKVQDDVKNALKNTFTFEKRAFAQTVTEAEVLSIILGVDGVIAAELAGEKLKVTKGPVNPPFPGLKMEHLRAEKAHWVDPEKPTTTRGAQLLLINTAPGGIILTEMSS